MSHTQGRLRIGTPPPNGEQTIGTEQGLMVAVATTGIDMPTKANARRLVACWNACEGAPTEWLETNKPVAEIADEIRALRAVNAELVDALEWYAEQTRLCRLIHSGGDSGRAALDADGGQKASAALAKAKELKGTE